MTRLRMHRDLLRIWSRSGKTIVRVTHDVDEALFLADRIIVCSSRPANIVSDTRVNTPRPRNRAHPRCAELRNALLRDLELE